MSESTFTPGPWVSNEALVIHAERGDTIAEVVWTDFYRSDDLSERSYSDEAQGVANARLIAAAPELLEALEYWVEYARFDPRYAAWLGKARDAIAKARGES